MVYVDVGYRGALSNDPKFDRKRNAKLMEYCDTASTMCSLVGVPSRTLVPVYAHHARTVICYHTNNCCAVGGTSFTSTSFVLLYVRQVHFSLFTVQPRRYSLGLICRRDIASLSAIWRPCSRRRIPETKDTASGYENGPQCCGLIFTGRKCSLSTVRTLQRSIIVLETMDLNTKQTLVTNSPMCVCGRESTTNTVSTE
ncbi:hypothetical protein J6590_023885 [Homalodisca vitripennis]|nr:hypothetical protein J6590_023885 [Homalodisca vitripennis]